LYVVGLLKKRKKAKKDHESSVVDSKVPPTKVLANDKVVTPASISVTTSAPTAEIEA
jgi:hypothetical protein